MTTFAIGGLQLALSSTEDNRPYIENRLAALCHTYPWVQMVMLSELALYRDSSPVWRSSRRSTGTGWSMASWIISS